MFPGLVNERVGPSNWLVRQYRWIDHLDKPRELADAESHRQSSDRALNDQGAMSRRRTQN